MNVLSLKFYGGWNERLLKLDNYLIPKIVPSIYIIGLILCIIVGLIQILENSWY